MVFEPKILRLLMYLREAGIHDLRVLQAIEKVPRHVFVPDLFQDKAYEDVALPIGEGQTISQPLVVAMMSQLLAIGDRHSVLEIGTGSGYQTAILAQLARRVYTVERHRQLQQQALQRLNLFNLSNNVIHRVGDGSRGWAEAAPFDRIIVTAAWGQTTPPEQLLQQLSPQGGMLLIPLTSPMREQHMVLFMRQQDQFDRHDYWPVRFVPLLPEGPPKVAAAL